jgi:hypothetical protein
MMAQLTQHHLTAKRMTSLMMQAMMIISCSFKGQAKKQSMCSRRLKGIKMTRE